MKVWMFNNYNTLPEHGPMNRHYNFGRQMREMGHEPVVFVGSHPHNSDVQLLEGPEKYRVFQEEPFPWVLVKTCQYGKSRKKRILSMFQYYINAKRAAKYAAERYGKPDAVLGSSAHPLAALLAVRLGKRYGCRSAVEIRDLWPESIVAYGIAGPHNPAVVALRILEKWLYRHADAVIFTQEGAYDYIVEQGWEREIPRSKVHYINNGVDLKAFDYSKEHDRIEDPDLEDPDTYKVVYTGALRDGNRQIYALFDAIRLMQGEEFRQYRFFIYGSGGLLPDLERRCREEGYHNVFLKGFVDKRYIPYILSKCDLNILNCQEIEMTKYGGSQNKLFDYLASGHPVISGEGGRYSIIRQNGCGISRVFSSPEELVAAIRELKEHPVPAAHIRSVAGQYDFQKLTEKLLCVLAGRAAQ